MASRIRVTARELQAALSTLEGLAEEIGANRLRVRKSGKVLSLAQCKLYERRQIVRRTLPARFLLRKLLYATTLDVERIDPGDPK